MKYQVYIDVIFIINFIMDYIYIEKNIIGIRDMNYNSVGNMNGKLPLVTCEKMIINMENNKKIILNHPLIAICKDELSLTSKYDVLINSKVNIEEED